MKYLIIVAGLLAVLVSDSFGQTTQTSGNWSDPTIWSGGSVPAASGTVTVNNPVTIDGNLSPTGNWTFNSNATDQPGGTAYTFNPSAGSNTITVSAGIVVSFEGGTSGTPNQFNSGTIDVYGTLILGYTQFNNSGNLNVNIEPGGTLIINGDLASGNNSGTFTINGALIVNGNFSASTGHVTVAGSGTINTTGTLTSTGGSTIFGTTNDCTTGPCSGGSLVCTFANRISPVSKVICTGTSAGTLSSTNSATSPTYQWLTSTDNVTYTNAPGASNASSYVTPSLTQTTWYKLKITSSGGCTSTSPETKITVVSGGGWLGGTSNDWGTASNWCSLSVPTSTTDVTISNAAGVTYMPTINSGTAAAARNLTISNTYPASSVTIAASGTASLSLYGDLTNNGLFTDNSTAAAAGVKISGSVAQNISSVSAMAVNNLTINNGNTTKLNNNLSVNSNLTMTSGLVNLGGTTFTLGVSAASPASLAYSTGSWFYGGNVMRWLPSSTVLGLGANASLFPLGDASNYRPMYFGSSGLTTGGTIKVSHTSLNGATAVSFPDGGSTVLVRSNSYWTVATGNGIAGTAISVRTEGTGFGIVGNVSDLRLTLASAAAPGTAGVNAGTLTNPQVNRTGFSAGTLSNTYYWGSVNPGFTTLPVELVSFAGVAQSGKVVLNWRTAGMTASYFAVERSVDGINFVEIGKVAAGDGAVYTYTDESPFARKDYYRLRLVDQAGAISYSGVIVVDFSDGGGFVLFPNPSDGRSITARVGVAGQAAYSIDVFDDQGRRVGHGYSADATQTINFTPVLSPGVYFARLWSTRGVMVRRFVVSRF